MSRGETERAPCGEIPIATKELKEPVNVAKRYDFALQNASAYRTSPEMFWPPFPGPKRSSWSLETANDIAELKDDRQG